MRYIEFPPGAESRLLPFYLSVEEYVARKYDDDCFFIWQVDPTVIVGRNQLIAKEVDEEYCRRQGIHVFRRKSGGGCVYSDRGGLMLSFVVSEDNAATAFVKCMTLLRDALCSLGIAATLSGRNDVMIGDGKVAGAAFYRSAGKSIMHTTLLYDTDLDLLSRPITPSAEKLEGRGVESVRKRVDNVGRHTSMTMDEFRGYIRQRLCGDEAIRLSEMEVSDISVMEREMVTRDFIYGHNPKYSVHRKRYIDGVGEVEAFIDVKKGRIHNINLLGDYFLLGDLDNDLLRRLRGVELTREAITGALADVSLSDVIRGMTKQQLMELLLNRI